MTAQRVCINAVAELKHSTLPNFMLTVISNLRELQRHRIKLIDSITIDMFVIGNAKKQYFYLFCYKKNLILLAI